MSIRYRDVLVTVFLWTVVTRPPCVTSAAAELLIRIKKKPSHRKWHEG